MVCQEGIALREGMISIASMSNTVVPMFHEAVSGIAKIQYTLRLLGHLPLAIC